MAWKELDTNPFGDTSSPSGGWKPVGFDPFAEEEEQGFVGNTARGVADRALDLGGNLLGFIGNVAKEGERALADWTGINPTVKFGSDGISFEMEADPETTANPALAAGDALKDVDTGYKPTFTWERLKGDITPSNAAGFIVEQGVTSLPDMVAALTTLPAYVAARTNEMAETREQNKGTDADGEISLTDLGEAAPAAVASALLERVGATSVFKPRATDGVLKAGGRAFAAEGAVRRHHGRGHSGDHGRRRSRGGNGPDFRGP